jgi:hypothetical protein
MPTGPFEDSFKVRSILHLKSSFIMKRSVMDDTQSIAGSLIAQGKEVGEVVFAEGGVIVKQALDALVSFNGGLLDSA